MRNLIVLFIISTLCLQGQTGLLYLKGKVEDSKTGEPLFKCTVTVLNKSNHGASTDSSGRFSIPLYAGTYIIRISYIGYSTYEASYNLTSSSSGKEVIIRLEPSMLEQQEVVVTVKSNDNNLQTISSRNLEKMPNMYGDILKSVQILSGVATNNELSSSYNVRGGSYDENLIYLNGYEIFRPFLLKQGVEENQSLVNQDMVKSLDFYNGAFSAKLGDKMSSALEVTYDNTFSERLSGSVRADLFNAGIMFNKKSGNLNWIAGARLAYPGLFLRRLQTKGTYNPSFSDGQVNAVYNLSDKDNIEFTGIYAVNSYDTEPEDWAGNFVYGLFDYRGIDILYDGYRNYDYTTSLAGLRYNRKIRDDLSISVSGARYGTKENDVKNITGQFYYFPDPYNSDYNREYLKTRNEMTDNHFSMDMYEVSGTVNYKTGGNQLEGGFNWRNIALNNNTSESFYETGDSLIYETPYNKSSKKKYSFNSVAAYINNYFFIGSRFILQAGIRALSYSYNNEFLVSPRAMLSYKMNENNLLSFNWGYYYQPPFYSELKYDTYPAGTVLKSQSAVHYTLGWENQFMKEMKYKLEVYYKKLDNLIPYYLENQSIVYLNGNTNEGYAYGFDLMFEGELVKGMHSWLGYSYLDTKERNKNGGEYRRRLTDQTHTLQIFIQDKIKKHENWQANLRFLFGSGLLYYLPALSTDPQTGERKYTLYSDLPNEYLIYLRVDTGLSATFDVGSNKIIATAEILNVFDQNNVAGYSFIRVFKSDNYPVMVPEILSKRFFNVKVEYKF